MEVLALVEKRISQGEHMKERRVLEVRQGKEVEKGCREMRGQGGEGEE